MKNMTAHRVSDDEESFCPHCHFKDQQIDKKDRQLRILMDNIRQAKELLDNTEKWV